MDNKQTDYKESNSTEELLCEKALNKFLLLTVIFVCFPLVYSYFFCSLGTTLVLLVVIYPIVFLVCFLTGGSVLVIIFPVFYLFFYLITTKKERQAFHNMFKH